MCICGAVRAAQGGMGIRQRRGKVVGVADDLGFGVVALGDE